MERLVATITENVKRQTIAGRTYLVAPVSMIVPGVLNGSKGALYYPHDEVAKNHGVWNNVPITYGHPYGKNNEAVSARDPETLDKFQLGAVYNDRFENGKRVADAWFDESITKSKAPEVYAALNSGSPMEVSTGLFTDDEPAQNGSNHGGVAYQFIAKNYRPDHLAVLPNQRGACSIRDGCGLNTNQKTLIGADGTREQIDSTTNAAPNQPKSMNTGKFKAMNAGTGRGETHQSAQDGWHGGKMPEPTIEPACTCPEGGECVCGASTTTNSKTKRGRRMDRNESVQWLTTNCECHKGKENILANADNYSDAEVSALVENEKRNQTNQLVVNQFVAAVPDLPSVKINEIPAFIKRKIEGEDEEEATDEESVVEEEAESEEKFPVKNKRAKMTANDYLAQMPADLRPVWDDMVANANDRRNELLAEVDKIVKNERDPQRRAIVENKLKGRMTNGELKELIALIRPTANAGRVAPAPLPVPAPHYWGSNPPPTQTRNEDAAPSELLELPTLNWSEMASPTYSKNK